MAEKDTSLSTRDFSPDRLRFRRSYYVYLPGSSGDMAEKDPLSKISSDFLSYNPAILPQEVYLSDARKADNQACSFRLL